MNKNKDMKNAPPMGKPMKPAFDGKLLMRVIKLLYHGGWRKYVGFDRCAECTFDLFEGGYHFCQNDIRGRRTHFRKHFRC